MLIVCMTP